MPRAVSLLLRSEPFDLQVDVTATLRANRIRPKHVVLHCLVEDEDGQLLPIEQTPVPQPIFRGPRFKSLAELQAAEEADDEDVVSEMQKARTPKPCALFEARTARS